MQLTAEVIVAVEDQYPAAALGGADRQRHATAAGTNDNDIPDRFIHRRISLNSNNS